MKRIPRWPITNKTKTNPQRKRARLRQGPSKLLGRFVSKFLRRGGMMFCSMTPIIRQPGVGRQASSIRIRVRIKMGEWMNFLDKLLF